MGKNKNRSFNVQKGKKPKLFLRSPKGKNTNSSFKVRREKNTNCSFKIKVKTEKIDPQREGRNLNIKT